MKSRVTSYIPNKDGKIVLIHYTTVFTDEFIMKMSWS